MALKFSNFIIIMSCCFLMKGFVLKVSAEESNSFSEINYKTACKNFDLTKEKLNAILRAHACKDVDYYECEQQLGLGKMGIITLGAGAMEAAALTAHSKVRNPNFVMCAVSQDPSFHFKMGPFWPSVAYAKCYDRLIGFRDQLRIEMQENAKAIDELIKEKSKELSVNDKDKKIIDLSTEKTKEGLEELKNKNHDNSTKLKNIFSEISDSSVDSEKDADNVSKFLTELKSLREKSVTMDKEAYRASHYDLLGKAVVDNQISSEQAKKISDLLSSEYLTIKKERLFKQKLDLEDLKKKKENFNFLFREFTLNPDLSPTKKIEQSPKSLYMTIQQIYASETSTEPLKKKLDYYSRELTRDYGDDIVGLDSSKIKNPRIARFFSTPLRINSIADLHILNAKRKATGAVVGGISSMVGMSAANAAGLEELVSHFDPLELTQKTITVKSAGDCKDMNSMVPRDPNNNCQIITEMNDELFKTFSEADEEELESLFGSQEICGYIQGTYEKNYPKVKSKNLSCNTPKPWNVEFENKTKLVIQNDKVELSGAELAGTLQYDLNAAKTAKPIAIKEYGETFRVAHQWHRNILPDYRKIWQQMKVATIEMVSCCSDGVTPSESECARYGIKSKNSDGAGKASETGEK